MKRIGQLLEMVDLDRRFWDYYPKELSGGMQQRVAIVRALALDPPLLLMDEPFGALDDLTRKAMQMLLLDLWSKTQKTILMVTHSISEACFMSDRVVVLHTDPVEFLASSPPSGQASGSVHDGNKAFAVFVGWSGAWLRRGAGGHIDQRIIADFRLKI
jgi:ABC-type nitrate/sulfonate/bicarbonate transport system ATPase subunit